ncbi:MAG: hypothetical protein WCA37_12990, partial [Terracidiphilus sp.]
MLQAVIAAVAILVGILLGFWIRSQSARAEKALLEQRAREAADAQAQAQKQLAEAQAESAARAGFEKLAVEREKALGQIYAEREGLRLQLEAKTQAERDLSARIASLESALKAEQKALQEKVALLDEA